MVAMLTKKVTAASNRLVSFFLAAQNVRAACPFSFGTIIRPYYT
ncbi:hypothetical protein BTN50_0628 [Candidatus Enterovibrio altilux]|uniref:Uncharacterized protein n=1 Tax=Candidatus Enterovibrio altilux TaxID=1927128 RepID=A0A291B839_9GAMM|nr:hypothetical protein BTN50_0628 [Candidatus Enterovibrio luxaltus]